MLGIIVISLWFAAVAIMLVLQWRTRELETQPAPATGHTGVVGRNLPLARRPVQLRGSLSRHGSLLRRYPHASGRALQTRGRAAGSR